jgi:hypothetical protein
VLANIIAMSDDLLAALSARAATGPVTFTVILQSFGTRRADAQDRLRRVIERLRAAGLEVAGSVGHCDPIVAVSEAWDPGRYDEIIVSTLPMRVSKWLHAGLPERIAQRTGAPVTHVVCRSCRPPVPVMSPRPQPNSTTGPLSPLRAWEAIAFGLRRPRHRRSSPARVRDGDRRLRV